MKKNNFLNIVKKPKTFLKYLSVKKNNYFIIFIYFALSIIFWGIPQGFNFINNINISGDPAFYLWCLKWWHYAISHGLNPFITKTFWAPFAQNLAGTTSLPSIAILMWPVTKIFGPVFSYNIITLISLTLAPYGIYLINREIGLKTISSFVGSLFFFFSTYILAEMLGHLTLYTSFIVVFLVYLYILRFKNSFSRLKYIVLFSLLFAFQFGISNEIYATFAVFSFFAWLVAFILFFKNENTRKKLFYLWYRNFNKHNF